MLCCVNQKLIYKRSIAESFLLFPVFHYPMLHLYMHIIHVKLTLSIIAYDNYMYPYWCTDIRLTLPTVLLNVQKWNSKSNNSNYECCKDSILSGKTFVCKSQWAYYNTAKYSIHISTDFISFWIAFFAMKRRHRGRAFKSQTKSNRSQTSFYNMFTG